MLRQTLKKIIKGQKGQALPIVLILLLIGGLLIIPTLNYASTSLKGHEMAETNTMELYAADSGIEDALYWLIKGRQTEGPWEDWGEDVGYGERVPYNMNDRSVRVVVERMDEMGANIYKITSTATSPDGHTTVLSTVWAIPWIEGDLELGQHDTYDGDVHVTGDVTVGNNASIVGNVTASGDITLEQHSSIEGDVSVDGNITLENNTTITGTVCCSGDITLKNGAEIIGDIRVGDGSTITLDEPAQIVGNIWADGDLSIYIRTNGDIGCEGNPDVGHIYAAGDINIYLAQSNAIIWGTVMDSEDEYFSPHEGKGEIKGIGDPPSSFPECPGIPVSPTNTLTFEIAHS